MGNSLTETQMMDSEEAFEGAKYTAERMIKSLRKDYSDKIIRMAFEAALNESYEGIFNIIYENAEALREDTTGSFADYIKKIASVLSSPESFGAAVQVRLTGMASDNRVPEASWDEFKKKLISENIRTPDLLFMSQLYFYRVKYPKIEVFEKMALPNLSIRANEFYTSYKRLLRSQREDLCDMIKDKWYANTKLTAKPKQGLLQRILKL